MSLPVIVAPTYEIKLHSIVTPVKFRPYLVKEEKILMMAQQGEDPKEIENAVKQIIRNCTNDLINVDALSTFDLEYMYLQLRSKSVNNVVELRYTCHHRVPTEADLEATCLFSNPVSIDLNDVKIHTPEGHTKKIMLTDKIGVTLKYPTAENAKLFNNNTAIDAIDSIIACLDTVFTTAGDVHEISEAGADEIMTFIESLSIPQMEKIKQFFETMPTLSYTIKFKCAKCGYTEDIVLSGLQDFFG